MNPILDKTKDFINPINGETYPTLRALHEATDCPVPYKVFRNRLKQGWSIQRSLIEESRDNTLAIRRMPKEKKNADTNT